MVLTERNSVRVLRLTGLCSQTSPAWLCPGCEIDRVQGPEKRHYRPNGAAGWLVFSWGQPSHFTYVPQSGGVDLLLALVYYYKCPALPSWETCSLQSQKPQERGQHVERPAASLNPKPQPLTLPSDSQLSATNRLSQNAGHCLVSIFYLSNCSESNSCQDRTHKNHHLLHLCRGCDFSQLSSLLTRHEVNILNCHHCNTWGESSPKEPLCPETTSSQAAVSSSDPCSPSTAAPLCDCGRRGVSENLPPERVLLRVNSYNEEAVPPSHLSQVMTASHAYLPSSCNVDSRPPARAPWSTMVVGPCPDGPTNGAKGHHWECTRLPERPSQLGPGSRLLAP